MAFPPVPFQEWFLRQTSTGNAALNAYVARVKADGGVVEAIGCVPLAVWDWVAPVAPSFVGLLDLFPNAAAAYSLRKLRAAYSGAAVRVRESGGNTEADIGFDANGDLDTSALLAHCGANDGFVTVWYDQSLSNDATQTTAANQPKIVSAGSLVTENGKAAINADGTDVLQTATGAIGSVSALSAFSVLKYNVSGANNDMTYGISSGAYGASDDNFYFRQFSGNFQGRVTDATQTSAINLGTADTSRYLFSHLFVGGSKHELVKNGVSTSDTTNIPSSLNLSQNLQIFSALGTILASDMKLQELIFFKFDQSSNRTGIETNINNFYSIYP